MTGGSTERVLTSAVAPAASAERDRSEDDPRVGHLMVAITALNIAIVVAGPLLLLLDQRSDVHPVVRLTALVGAIALPAQCVALFLVLRGPLRRHRRLARVRSVVDGILARRDVRTVFQPICDSRSGRVVGAEALTRFDHVDLKVDAVFRGAVDTGRGRALDLLALRSALAAALHLPDHLYVSVNLSPPTLGDPALCAALESSPVELDRIVVELTEHEPVDEYGPLAEAVQRLQSYGVRLAVDDAGSGYASFRHVVQLAPEVIKVDRALVENVDQVPAKASLVRAVVSFADERGITVVAEGVERDEEQSRLGDLGVHCVQGYLTGRPTDDPEVWASWS